MIRDIKVAIENMLNQDSDMIEHVLVLLGDNGFVAQNEYLYFSWLNLTLLVDNGFVAQNRR